MFGIFSVINYVSHSFFRCKGSHFYACCQETFCISCRNMTAFLLKNSFLETDEKLRRLYSPQLLRSKFRYPMASAKWWVCILSLPSRSAMVRATFRIRVYARADKSNFVIALWSSSKPSLSGSAYLWISLDVICALQKTSFTSLNLSVWILRAAMTRLRISLLCSPCAVFEI